MSRFEGYGDDVVRQRLSNWRLFHPRLYVHLHADLPRGEAAALDHFTSHGCWEGRPFTTQTRLAADLFGLEDAGPASAGGAFASVPKAMLHRAAFGIYTNSGSNFFMRELGQHLAAGLRRLGLQVTEGDETTPPDDRQQHCIIVAPHEFFTLGAGAGWARADIVANAVMLATEQPQTTWFIKSLPYLLSCRGILDLCWQTSATFEAAGIPASFYMPGMSQSPWLARPLTAELRRNGLIASLPQAALDFTATDGPLAGRPIDVTFMASASPIRDEFLSRHLPALRDLKTILIYRRPSHSVPKSYAPNEEITQVNDFVLRRSKILLNIHRDTLGYFEIHRIGLLGIWNGCAVVTNACLPHRYFVANEHYFEETVDRIPKLIDWLVKTPEGRHEAERVRNAAMAKYADEGNQRAQSLITANFLARCFDLTAPAA